MTAASIGPAIRSSHLRQPVEVAPLLGEGPRQLVVVEVPALRRPVRQGERGKGAASAQHQYTNRYIQENPLGQSFGRTRPLGQPSLPHPTALCWLRQLPKAEDQSRAQNMTIQHSRVK